MGYQDKLYTEDWDYNRKKDAGSRQRTSTIKAVEKTQNGNQDKRLSQTGPLTGGE